MEPNDSAESKNAQAQSPESGPGFQSPPPGSYPPPGYYPPPAYGQVPYYQPPAPGYGAPYPPYGYARPVDPGESDASSCQLFGILSLVTVPFIFAIIALIRYNSYKRTGNGMHASAANTGRVCAIISLVMNSLALVGVILYFVFFIGVMGIMAFSS